MVAAILRTDVTSDPWVRTQRQRVKYGIIGNCAYSALIEDGSVEWMCWPRMDSSFIFGRMLDRHAGGEFKVEFVGEHTVHVEYIENTNVLRTVFEGPSGSFELIDFAPRFLLFGRWFRPTMLMRILRRLGATVTIELDDGAGR